jgi:flagellar hook-associated protein 2
MKDGDLVEFRARAKASIEYTVGGGERKELTIESDESLAELVRNVNENGDLGLRADILNDGSASNPYRLLLTSLTEGSAGEIDILYNSSAIKLDGVSAEAPVAQSSTYTGEVSVDGTLSAGAGNNSIIVEMMEDGGLGSAKFKISADGGLTFHDNNGAGFTLSGPGGDGKYSFDLDSATKDNGDQLFASALNIDLKLTNSGGFSKGDRITVDLFDAEIQSAQDALLNVDGITLVKSSNTVDDVFEGLTLNLKNADAGKTVQVSVAENVGDVASVMEGFVESYNSVMSLIHANSKYNPDEDSEAPLLMGDSTMRQIQSSLQKMITGRLSHLDSGLSSLADLGISTDSKTGQLNFDSSKLSKALTDDPNGVRRLLSSFGEDMNTNHANFVSSTSATSAGVYSVKVLQARTQANVVGTNNAKAISTAERLTIRVNSDAQGTGSIRSMVVDLGIGLTVNQQVEAIQDEFDSRDLDIKASLEDGKIVIRHNEYGDDYKIEVTSDQATGDSGFTSGTKSGVGTDLKGTINGVLADVSGDALVGKKGYGFEGLRVRIDNDFTGDAGQISVSEGLGSSFSKLLDSFVGFDGLLSNKIDSFDSTISRFEEQMSRVTERATKLEDRLRQQFVNLEVTLGLLNSTGEYLMAQLQSLPALQINKR